MPLLMVFIEGCLFGTALTLDNTICDMKKVVFSYFLLPFVYKNRKKTQRQGGSLAICKNIL